MATAPQPRDPYSEDYDDEEYDYEDDNYPDVDELQENQDFAHDDY